MARRAALLLSLALAAPVAAGQTTAGDAIGTLVARLEQAGVTGDRDAILAQSLPGTPIPALAEFADVAVKPPSRFIIKERDRSPLENGWERLLLEVFVQRDDEAAISTWRMDVARAPGSTPERWVIADIERLSIISGLYRLGLNAAKQFDVRNLTVRGPDLTIELPIGTAFVAETGDGPTAVVLMGKGRMHFTPQDVAEQTQVRIFSGDSDLQADFDAAFIRVRPGDLDWRFGKGALVARAVSKGDLRKAQGVFDEYIGRTLNLDLTDLSRERWSLTPASGDLIAEVRTRKFGSLTYARAGKDAEDVSLFDRRRRRNISIYASSEKLAARGRFYNEDDGTEYDVIHHEIEAAFDPERLWIDGRASVRIRIRALALTTLTLRLAEPLTVRSIVSPELGRLLHLRVVGQNSVIVNLPGTVIRNTELWLQVNYSGRIEPQMLEREAITVDQQNQEYQEAVQIRLEPQWVYSNRSYWHPQSTVTDYATARIRIIVPPDFDVVASGTPVGTWAPAPGPVAPGGRPRKMFVFESDRPARYFGCIISRFSPVTTARLNISSGPPLADGDDDDFVSLIVQANPRQVGKARSLSDKAAAILEYYASLLGDAPYPSFTLAVAESDLPGGHSPPYFAILNQTLPMSTLVWRNDPVSFDNYSEFFLAHELAHQWWGQAIGWKNYHEQWVSEGFAQYFAALYAAEERGDDLLANLMRQMRRWAIQQSDEGPVYLGYRLGHIKGEGRVFRAIIYNKGAMVLHMLRRFVGDKTFFAGVRRFYTVWKYRKAGTNDFRVAMEESGASDLTPFFEAWIYGTTIPELRFTYDAGPSSAVLRFEHRKEVVPVPVMVTVTYASGDREEFVIPILERAIERTIPLKGPVRIIEVNRDNGALAEFSK
jgi:hypothetical protein